MSQRIVLVFLVAGIVLAVAALALAAPWNSGPGPLFVPGGIPIPCSAHIANTGNVTNTGNLANVCQ